MSEELTESLQTMKKPARGKRLMALGLGMVSVLALVLFLSRGDGVVPVEPSGADLNFAEAVLTDLVEVTEFEGTLGQIEDVQISVRRSGTITAVVESGSVIDQGDPLVWIDNEPVILLYGELPAWRRISTRVEGPDVMQLEVALSEMGFNPDGALFTIDEEFTSSTKGAVEEWQASVGMVADGVVDQGEILFREGPINVNSVLVEVGDQIGSGTPILTTSKNDFSVSFSLPAVDRDTVPVGTAVTITLPDLRKVEGTVSEISAVASSSQSFGSVFAAIVQLSDASQVADIEQVPVTVEVVTDRRDSVVAVPVQALLALLEGGYAVEVKTPTDLALVPVEVGFYASGWIEVGGEISPGDLVVVP